MLRVLRVLGLTESLIEEIRVLLRGLAVLVVAIAIEHPGRDLELQRVADHSHDLVDLCMGWQPLTRAT